jgi:hypothetical protein
VEDRSPLERLIVAIKWQVPKEVAAFGPGRFLLLRVGCVSGVSFFCFSLGVVLWRSVWIARINVSPCGCDVCYPTQVMCVVGARCPL